MKSLNEMVRGETDGQMVVVEARDLARLAALLRLMADTDYPSAAARAVASDMLRHAAAVLTEWAERPS